MNASRAYGKLLLTTTRQPAGAPLFDTGLTCEVPPEGSRTWGSIVLRIPRRRTALVLGWEGANPHLRLLKLRWAWRRLRYRGWPDVQWEPTMGHDTEETRS